MRETIQQLEAEERAALLIKQQREQYPYKFTADHADRLSKATYGGYYTNPEITASVGLSDIPIDTQPIHSNAQKQALAHSDALRSRTNIATEVKPSAPKASDNFTIYDLLRMDPRELAVRHDHQPDWWDRVDPVEPASGLNWRAIPIPVIKEAKDLMDLPEAQVIKLYLSNPDGWQQIPGMVAKDVINTDGERTGKFWADKDLAAKFPTLDQVIWANSPAQDRPQGTLEIAGATLMANFQTVAGVTGGVISVPFKTLGFFTPDHIGPAGGFKIEAAGVTIPSRISVKDIVGKPVRAASKTITAGLQGGGQVLKNTLEYAATHRGGTIGTFTATNYNWEDYKKTVIEGNIITQILKSAVTEGRLDLGAGFFPEGQILERAREAHDAGLPKIGGRTWTAGNALIEPLIKENYIDRNGYAAQILSGLADGVFTLGTDITLAFNPVKSISKVFKIEDVAATTLLQGRAADIARENWALKRQAAGLSTIPKEVIEMPWGTIDESGAAKEFFGMLPPGTKLPDDAEAFAQAMADEAMAGKSLVSLDSPPPVVYKPPTNSIDSIKSTFGLTKTADGSYRFDPMKIDEMPFTRDGQITLNKLSSFKNSGELYDYFLGKIPIGAAVKIQEVVEAAAKAGNAVNTDEIFTVIREAVLSGDPFYNIREVPGVIKSWTTQTGPRIAQWTSGKTRQFATMPGTTFFSFDDPMNSVKDMNNLMINMKVPVAERHSMLTSAMKAVVNGEIGKRFDLSEQWMKTMLSSPLTKNNVPEEWIKKLVKFKGDTNDIAQWTWDAMGDGYPASWLADGSGDVIRSTDMIPKGFMMVHPEQLKQVIRETTNLWEVFAPFRGNPAMEKLLKNSVLDELEKFQVKWMKPAALGAPFPVRMLTRIIPDELLRIAVAEGLSISSLKALMASGHVNINTFGVEIKTARQIQKLEPLVERIDDLQAGLKAARAANDAVEIAKYTDLISAFTAKNGTKKELLEQIGLFEERINQSLPGTGRNVTQIAKGLMADEMADQSVLTYIRQMRGNAVKDIAYDVAGNPIIDPESTKNINWVKGTARDIVQMSETPEYQEVAKAMLAGGSDAVIQLPNRFLSGDLKPVFEKIWARALKTQGVNGMSKLTPLTSVEGNSAWIYTIYNDILTRTGGERTAIGAIASGKLGVEKIIDNSGWSVKTSTVINVYEPTTTFNNWVRDNLLQNPNTAKVAPFAADEATEAVLRRDRLFTKGFALYRNASAKYARGPYWEYNKWKRILELMPAMDPQEAQKMMDALDSSKAADWIKDGVRAELPRAAGTATRKQVELLGDMFGNQQVDDLLYNSSKKSYFGSRHSLLFGFFDAWKEQWSVWGRLMAENPQMLEVARQTKEGLMGAELPGWAGGQDGRGVIFTDEDTGQQAVALPFSREVYSMLGLNAEERIQTKNLTMLGSAVPGFFGFGAMVMDSIFPKSQAYADLRETLFPFGDPQARTKIADYFLAPWAQGAIGAGTSAARGGTQFDLITNIQAMAATETNDSIRASTLNAVLTNIASNRSGIPATEQEREAIINDAVNKTDALLAIKSLFKILLPGASMTKYFTEVDGGNVTTGMAMDELRTMTDTAIKNGGTYTDGVAQFLGKYGPDAWIFLAGGTNAMPGLAPTKEFAEWTRSNGDLLDKYPLVAGYLGPQGGEFDLKAYSSQSAIGLRTPRDIEARQEKALNSMAWSAYNYKKDQYLKFGIQQGFTPEQITRSEDYKADMKAYADTLKKQFPMWNPAATSGESERELVNEIRQITKMVEDKKVLATPTGKALKLYWDYRTAQVDAITAQDPTLANDSWRKAKAGSTLRQALYDYGYGLSEKYPDFAALWENVLSREFEPPEIGM
jgi:hypothetical protein